MNIYPLLRSILFSLDAESAHNLTFSVCKTLQQFPALLNLLPHFHYADKPISAFNLTFPNPVGLAAGLDKNALLLPFWQHLGFGFVEIGTITPRPQVGNPRPRLFRLPQDKALINRMGFNNEGIVGIKPRIATKPKSLILGINIGKNKDTPNELAYTDYVQCFNALHEYGDYFVINVSSPNTPGLRALQEADALNKIVSELQILNHRLPKPKPILVKVAPDLTDDALLLLADLVKANGLAGVVATNTTISREALQTPKAELESIGAGGLSGAPLLQRSTEVVQLFSQAGIAVIGVGGIQTGKDAVRKMNAGAKLVQVYSGFIYQGPQLLHDIFQAIAMKWQCDERVIKLISK